MAERDPLIGRHLGAYQIQEKLGEGGMARVYKAYQARLRRDVAIKVILAHIAGHGDFRARFEREAQLIASLEHPNIVAVYDFGEEGMITYLVMQYVGGGTLRDQLRDGYPLPSQMAALYALQMARALHSAHLRGIVHRDVKPQNMLVSANNRNQLLLSDFGIAKLFDSTHDYTLADTTAANSSYTSGQTSADQILGTIEYMAPEQINRKDVDARTDVYALGVVLFQMLTGRVPFLSTTTTGLMYQHVHTPPPLVRDLNPAAPEILVQITAKALEKAPAARFQSAEALALALESALNGVGSKYSTSRIINGAQTHISPMSPLVGGYGSEAPGMRAYELPAASSGPASVNGQQFLEGARSGPQQNTGPTMGNRPLERGTTAGGSQNSIAVPPNDPSNIRTRKPISMQMIIGIAVLVVSLALLVMRFQFFNGNGTPPQTTATASAFTEIFTNNNNAWIEGDNNGLTSSVAGGQYTLNTSQGNTYFPYPTKIGVLPSKFTFTAQIRQDKGALDRTYGIVFYLNGQTKSCYAFVITSNGEYALLRYDNGVAGPVLWSEHTSTINTIHKSNTLQATVDNGRFSFKINGKSVGLKNATSLTDTTYTTGQPGLMVTGPDTQFTATKVQLTIS